jgi:hypothetical protein
MTFPVRCCPVHGARSIGGSWYCDAPVAERIYCGVEMTEHPAELVGEGPSREAVSGVLSAWAECNANGYVFHSPLMDALTRLAREAGGAKREGERNG